MSGKKYFGYKRPRVSFPLVEGEGYGAYMLPFTHTLGLRAQRLLDRQARAKVEAEAYAKALTDVMEGLPLPTELKIKILDYM